jgi:hypothetical protein
VPTRPGFAALHRALGAAALVAFASSALAQPEPAPSAPDASAPMPPDASAPEPPAASAPMPPDASAPDAASTPDASTPAPPAAPQELPFAIAEEKRLEDEELAEKKEGIFVTGFPDFSSDPLNGIGLGGEGYVTYDGTRADPFFAYTPYRSRVTIAAFLTTKNQQMLEVGLDVPYLFDSPWRLRTVAEYANDPNQLYFGTTDASLRHLRSLYPARSAFVGMPTGSFGAYEDNLATVRAGGPGEAPRVADNLYDYFRLRQALLNTSVERSIFHSLMRVVAGFEVGYVDITTYDGKSVSATDPTNGATVTVPNGTTRLTEQAAAGNVVGMGHGFVNIAQVGLVYDTRDFEPDPTRGIFAEVTNEVSVPAIGSRFAFDKVFGHVKGYAKLFAYGAQRLVLASRLGVGYTFGSAPFFEFQDEWSTEGSIEALGGFHTLRGYKQARFVSRMMTFGNLELRHRFARFSLLGQSFGLMVVPFVDTGGVFDRPSAIAFDHLRISEGAGLRVAWNQSTIVSFDYAVSEEDHQFFVALGHAF